MITKETNRYLVNTSGLTGRTSFQATDPDEALMFAHRYERFLRVRRNHPQFPIEKVRRIANDECEIPDFRIESCILEGAD
jgi:hypothetical protein